MSDHGFKIMVEHATETIAARDAEITRLREALAQARVALEIIAGIRTPYDLLVTNKEVALEGLRKIVLPKEEEG